MKSPLRLAASLAPLAVVALVLLASGCNSVRAKVDAPSAAAPTAPAKKSGIFAPSDAVAWSYWPEEWSGSLLVLAVKPHGSTLKSGDEIARFDTRTLDESIRQGDLDLASARVRHNGLVERQRIEEEAARSAFAQSTAALDRAKRSLEGYLSRELQFSKRSDELAQRREASYIEDQVDELAELQQMYEKDQLVEGTEEKVLKRNKRQLALTKDGTALSREQARYHFELAQVLDKESREEAVRTQTEGLERLRRSQDIERRARSDADSRSSIALADQEKKAARLAKDREALLARSSRDGVLLHGAVKDYRPGRTSPRHERGNQLAARADLFTVVDPAPRALTLDVAEVDLTTWKDGAKVVVKPSSGASLPGTLHVDTWPRPDGQHEARVDLDAPATAVTYGTHADVELVP